MYYRSKEKSGKAEFWKVYLITMAIFLTIGFLPSLPIIMRNGPKVILLALPREIVPESLLEESVSDLLSEDWITYPRSATSMVGRERGEILLELESFDPDKDIANYYKEEFGKNGYSWETERDGSATVIKAQKDKVYCNVRILQGNIVIVIGRARS